MRSRKLRLLSFSALGFAALAPSAFAAPTNYAQLCIPSGRARLCQSDDTTWKLRKTLESADANSLTWEVRADKLSTSNAMLAVHGWIRVRNYGAVPATLGNVVVNLQRPTGCWWAPWVSAAAVVADATNGDAATSANLLRTASLEHPGVNAFFNVNNYVAQPFGGSGAGTFTETAASGALNLTDAATNSVFSLAPEQQIAPGATLELRFTATFDNTVLGLAPGSPVRTEVLVSHGKAPRWCWSSDFGRNIDINGDCGVDSTAGDGLPGCPGGMTGADDGDESSIRTAVFRDWRCVPALEHCNASVVLADALENVTATGTLAVASYSTDIGGGTGVETISDSVVRHVTVTTNGGAGSLTNCATLTGEDDVVLVPGPNLPGTCIPGPAIEFPCCVGADLTACDSRDLAPEEFQVDEFCTSSNPLWGGDPDAGGAAALLVANFAAVYPGGEVEVGIPGEAGFSMRFTSAQAILDYLPQGSAVARALNADLVNPLTSFSRAFGGNVLALKLNVDFDDANVLGAGAGRLGDLHMCNTGTVLDGLTVDEVLAAANLALGGGPLPAGIDFTLLNYHVAKLSGAFADCEPSPYAQDFLCR